MVKTNRSTEQALLQDDAVCRCRVPNDRMPIKKKTTSWGDWMWNWWLVLTAKEINSEVIVGQSGCTRRNSG